MPWSVSDLPESTKNKEWSAHQKEVFVKAANAALKEYGDEGKAIAVGTAAADSADKKDNASQQPRVFYCRHMQPGTCRYDNETILVDNDGMHNLIKSVGKEAIPVYVLHQDVDLQNIKQQADGYITDSFYNELDGWAWFKGVAVDDKAHDAIRKGWRVSNSYRAMKWNSGGTKNNVPYKRELIDGKFEHLAIVPDPRYEGAMILSPEEFREYQEKARRKLDQMHNSKGDRTMKFFNFKKEEVATPDKDSMVELANGKTISLGAMIETVENSLASDKNKQQKVKVGDKEVTLAELEELYENAMKKKSKMKNSEKKMKEDPDEEDVEGDEEEEGDDEIGDDKKDSKKNKKKNRKKNRKDEEEDCMDNADSEDDERGDEGVDKGGKKKDNSRSVDVKDDKFFEEMRNAHLNSTEEPRPTIRTTSDQIKRGQEMYGSAKKTA